MRKLRTEEDIIANWKGDLETPVVSICCLAFNHELYIEDALEGFLIQETEFPFEVLIHDDASTDRTSEIIKKYAELYPSIIKPIRQVENQYSKGIKVNAVYNFSRAKGEYIALCEGDDYWVDSKKLAKQLKLIRKLDTDICFTNAWLEYSNDKRELRFKDSDQGYILPLSEVIRRGGGGMPTASLLVKTSILKELPDWFEIAPVGDLFIQILGSERNGAAYLRDVTSVYRVSTAGSWSSNRKNTPIIKIKTEAESYESILNGLRSESILSEDIDYAISRELYYLSVVSIKIGEFRLANELINRSWGYYKFLSIKQIVLFSTKLFWKYI